MSFVFGYTTSGLACAVSAPDERRMSTKIRARSAQKEYAFEGACTVFAQLTFHFHIDDFEIRLHKCVCVCKCNHLYLHSLNFVAAHAPA